MLELNFYPFPELESERLIFRRILKRDAAAIHALRSNPQVMKYIDRPFTTSEKDGLELIKKIDDSLLLNEGISWGITIKPAEEIIGTIGFWRIDTANHRGEIGYMLAPAYQKQGIMKETFKTIIPYGFDGLKLHSIEANVNPENIASKTLLEHHGFIQEAYFRENYFYNGQFLDSLIFCLLKEDFPSL